MTNKQYIINELLKFIGIGLIGLSTLYYLNNIRDKHKLEKEFKDNRTLKKKLQGIGYNI